MKEEKGMKRMIAGVIAGILFAWCAGSAGCARRLEGEGREGGKVKEETGVLRSEEGTFAVFVEQGGRLVGMKDHVARVKKEPFTVVLVLPGPGGVLVGCSDGAGLYEAARGSWRPLGEKVELDRRIEEAQGNPHHQVVLTEKAWHDWHVGGTGHTFEAITMKEGTYLCRRTIGATVKPGQERREIGRYEGSAMYLVFVRAGAGREQDREWVKVAFD